MKANKLFWLAMGLVAVGCNDSQIEEESLINNAQGEASEVVIDATIAQDSRAISNVKPDENGRGGAIVSLEFQQGDQIGVYLNNPTVGLTHENVLFTAGVKNEETGAMPFTTEEHMFLLGAGNHVYAYYPYAQTETGFEGSTNDASRAVDEVNLGTWDGYHHFLVKADQTQKALNDYSLLKENAVLYAPQSVMTKEGNKVNVDMQFKHAFSYATVELINNFGKDIAIDAVKFQFRNGADSEYLPLAGKVAIPLAEGKDIVYGEDMATSVLVKAEASEGMLLAKDSTGYVTAVVAPVEGYTTLEATVYTTDGWSFKIVKTWDDVDPLAQAMNTRFGKIALSEDVLGTEAGSSEYAEYLLAQNKENIVVDLYDNVELTLNNLETKFWGGEDTKTVTINGNGCKVTFTPEAKHVGEDFTTWNVISAGVDCSAKVIINDAVICGADATGEGATIGEGEEAEQISNTSQITTLNFASEVVTNNVNFEQAITVLNGATLNGTTLSDEDKDDNYRLWIFGDGQQVSLDGCHFVPNKNGGKNRGIKIYDGGFARTDALSIYSEPTQLTVSNTSFETAVVAADSNKDTKSAILVSTDHGAIITIGEGVDITKAGDPYAHVMVDEENSVAAEILVVNGGLWKHEGNTWSIKYGEDWALAEDVAGIEGAYTDGLTEIHLVDGVTYTEPALEAKEECELTILGSGSDNKAELAAWSFSGNKQLFNLTVKGVTATSTITSSKGKVAFEDVTFTKTNTYDVTTSPEATFTNCTFPNATKLTVSKVATLTECTFPKAKSFEVKSGAAGTVLNKCEFPSLVSESKVCGQAEFSNCEFTSSSFIHVQAKATFDGCSITSTGGRAIYVSTNACEVDVKDCVFTATKGWMTADSSSPLYNLQLGAAIDINNVGGLAHKVTTSNNQVEVGLTFSGEWRIMNYEACAEGEQLIVNNVDYKSIALDGKKMQVVDGVLSYVE